MQNLLCEKSCEIQSGGQEMAEMVVHLIEVNFVHRFT